MANPVVESVCLSQQCNLPGQIVILYTSEQPTQGHTGQDETDDRLEEDGTTLRAKANLNSSVVDSLRSYDNFETCLD